MLIFLFWFLQLTIKPVVEKEESIENNFNEAVSVPLPPREGSPHYMMANSDEVPQVSQRSAKKRRRYIKNFFELITFNYFFYYLFIIWNAETFFYENKKN